MERSSGFREVEHTADLCLLVWGKSLGELFVEAIKGLYSISRVTLQESNDFEVEIISFEENDLESLLISVLSECNYLLQNDKKRLLVQSIRIENHSLELSCFIQKVEHFEREIKAVTYHNLKIMKSTNGYSVQIVFDV